MAQTDKLKVIDKLLVGSLLIASFAVPVILGSIATIAALVLALLAGLRWAIAFRPNSGTYWQPTMTMFLIVFCLLGLSFTVTAKTPDDIKYVVNFLSLPLSFLLFQYLRFLPKRPTLLMIAWICWVGAIAGFAYAAYRFHIVGQGRITSMGAGANAVARVAAILGFIALCGDFKDFRLRHWPLFLAAVASTLTVIYTGSRGTLLALPFMASVLLLCGFPAAWSKSKPKALLGAVLLFVCALVVVWLDPARLSTRLWTTLISLTEGNLGYSSSLRFELLQAAWSAFQANPVWGYGWAGLWEASQSHHQTPEIFDGLKTYFSYHNDLADFAVAAGLVGIGCYIALLVMPLVNLIGSQNLRKNPSAIYLLVLLPVSFFVFGLTDFVFGFDLLTTVYVFLFAFIFAAVDANQASDNALT